MPGIVDLHQRPLAVREPVTRWKCDVLFSRPRAGPITVGGAELQVLLCGTT